MKDSSIQRIVELHQWIGCLEDINKEFPGSSTNIDTAIRSFKSQLKELEKK